MTTSVSQAVAQRDPAGQLIENYRRDFATVLPEHIRPDTWARLALGALRQNRKLKELSQRNPATVVGALMECARLGLEVGETFHLVPFGNEIVGITDYTGEIELIYRAGAVSSIKAEIVYSEDEFDFSPDMDRPHHKPDWFGERGEMIGAYAYALMKDGATSRVVVMGRKEIEKVKAVSKTANSSDSPWKKWEDRMWLKTVIKQLAKFVPTSAEYRREQLRAAVEADNLRRPQATVTQAPTPAVDVDTGEIHDAEVVDEEPPAEGQQEWPEPAQPGSKGGQ